jgi:hypothetical protein
MEGRNRTMQASTQGNPAGNLARAKAWLCSAWPWVLLLALSVGLGLYGRYGLIQSTPIGLLCQSADPAWFCGPRHLLWQIGDANGWAWAAILGGGAAILFGWRAAIVLAIVAGGAGLSLYNAGPAAFGLLMALMRLVRR